VEGRSAILPDPNLEYRYDCLYILNASVSPDDVGRAVEQFRNVVVDNGGGIIELTPMGQKRFAYEIGHEREGIYVDMVFWGKPAVEELRRRLRIDTRVIRHIIVKETDRQHKARIRAAHEKGAPTPAPTPTVEFDDEPTEDEQTGVEAPAAQSAGEPSAAAVADAEDDVSEERDGDADEGEDVSEEQDDVDDGDDVEDDQE